MAMSNLGQRLATAAVLVPALVASLFWDPTRWSILAFATVAAAFALDEYLRMVLGVTPPVDEEGNELPGGDDPHTAIRLVAGLGGAGIMVSAGVWGASAALAPAASPFPSWMSASRPRTRALRGP